MKQGTQRSIPTTAPVDSKLRHGERIEFQRVARGRWEPGVYKYPDQLAYGWHVVRVPPLFERYQVTRRRIRRIKNGSEARR